MRTLLTLLATALLGLVLAAAPASAGELEECGTTPGGSGTGSCLLVVGGDTVTDAETLPRTGGDSLPLAQIGIVLIALGGLTVAFTRGRRRTASA